MTFPYNIQSNTPPAYRFKLEGEGKSLILRTYPAGWKSGMLELNRRITEGGVFANFVTESLTFFKEGAKFLRDIWESKESNGKCDLHVYYWEFTTQSYVEFPNSFALYFPDCQPRVKYGRNTIGFQIKTQNNSTLMLLDNRKKTNVDITKLTSLGGYPIRYHNYQTMPEMADDIYFGAGNKSTVARWESTGGWNLPRKPGVGSYCSVPLTILDSGFTEYKDVPAVIQKEQLSEITHFFDSALDTYSLHLAYDITIDVTNKDNGHPWEIWLFEVDPFHNKVQEWNIGTLGSSTGLHNYKSTIDLNITSIGNSLILAVYVRNIADIYASLTHVYLQVYKLNELSSARFVQSFSLYNTFERLFQHILDTQYPFYSDYLSYYADAGIGSLTYDKAGTLYPAKTNQQLVYFSVFSGLCLRGAKLKDANNPLSLNFEDTFHSASSFLNLGYTLQQIGDFMRVRIEEYSWFFDPTVVLDLSSRISIYDIQTEAMPELAYQKIKVGFKNSEASENAENIRSEYNTEHERTTILNTNSELNLVSELRGDSTMINYLLSKRIDETGQTSEKGDNEMFILKTQWRDGTFSWKPETNENIQIVNQSSVLGVENSYNLYITPHRMLRRHNEIKAGLTKYPESYVKYQTSEKLQTLETTGEGYTAMENADIRVNDLADPIWKPIKHTVECMFTLADLESLQALITGTDKPGYMGVIKFSNTISGYLLNLKKKNKEDKAVITIIEKYTA